MAKKTPEKQVAISQPDSAFVELMLVAADFVKNCGGMEPAKKALEDTGRFIDRAGSVAAATKALAVLENLKSKISE